MPGSAKPAVAASSVSTEVALRAITPAAPPGVEASVLADPVLSVDAVLAGPVSRAGPVLSVDPVLLMLVAGLVAVAVVMTVADGESGVVVMKPM